MHVTPQDIAASVGTDPSLKPEDLLCRYLQDNTVVRFEGIVELFNDCGLIITEGELLSLLDMREDLLFTEGIDANGKFWKASIIEGYVNNAMDQEFEPEFDTEFDEFDPDAQDTEWDTGEIDPEGGELSGINAPPDAAEMTDTGSEYDPEPPEVTTPATDQSDIPPGAMPRPMPEIVAQALAALDPYGMEGPEGMGPEAMGPEGPMDQDQMGPGPMGPGMEGPTPPGPEGPMDQDQMGPGPMGPGMAQPGMEMPAQREPGMTVQPGPGEEMPSQAQPGMQQPGMQPGMQQMQPGMQQMQPGMQQMQEPQQSFTDDETDYTIDPFLDQMKQFTGEATTPPAPGEIPQQSPQTTNEPTTGAMTRRKRLHPDRYSKRMGEARERRQR